MGGRKSRCLLNDNEFREFQGHRTNQACLTRAYVVLREQVARLTTECERLVGEAERIDADYRKPREELVG